MLRIGIGQKYGQYRASSLSTIAYTRTAAALGAYDGVSASMVLYTPTVLTASQDPLPPRLTVSTVAASTWVWYAPDTDDAIVYWDPVRTEPTLYRRNRGTEPAGFYRVGRFTGSDLFYRANTGPAPTVLRGPSQPHPEPLTALQQNALNRQGPQPYIKRRPEPPHRVVEWYDGRGGRFTSKVYDLRP